MESKDDTPNPVADTIDAIFRQVVPVPGGILDLRSGFDVPVTYQLSHSRTLSCEPVHGAALLESLQQHLILAISDDLVPIESLTEAEGELTSLTREIEALRKRLLRLCLAPPGDVVKMKAVLEGIVADFPAGGAE